MTNEPTQLDFDARYAVDGWRGVAFWLKGYVQEADEDTVWTGEYVEDRSRVVAVMLGDDRDWIIETADLTLLDDDDYCSVCGQLGCSHDGR